MRVGLLTQFPSQAVQSGPAIHTRFLSEGLQKRGHHVLMMGPDTGRLAPVAGDRSFIFPSFAYATHPKVKVAMPGMPQHLFAERPQVDVIHGQSNCHMAHYGIWARKKWGIPFLNTNIIHLPTHSHFLLSDTLYANDTVRGWVEKQAVEMERHFAEHIYNQSDCFIVQSKHMVSYWRERGVTTPIEVVGRPINPAIFSAPSLRDPYPTHFEKGHRLLVVCRHDREKNLHELIDIFVKYIAPKDPKATLTLVGDGHDHLNLVKQGLETPFASRIYFSGEANHQQLVDWYAHADLFVYTSVSETFGNVVNEALWCGVPVVAYDDGMGVAGQIEHGKNGMLLPYQEDSAAHQGRFAAEVLSLLAHPERRQLMAESAQVLAHKKSHPDEILARFERIYDDAAYHRRLTLPHLMEEESMLRQMKEFSKHYAAWAWWNGSLIALGRAAKGLGASRKGGYLQHEEAEKWVLSKAKELESTRAKAAKTPAA